MIPSMSLIAQLAVLVVAGFILGGVEANPPNRVVGGEDGEIGEFPYQASVQKNYRHLCGGTIIGKRHILTAAHCIDGVSVNPAREMSVVTGTNAMVPGAGIRHVIKTATVHPNFSSKYGDSWKNDIAIIALTKDIVFDTFTKPARLPTKDAAAKLDCVASGWGDMSYPKGLQPNNVRKAGMTIVDNDECSKRHMVTKILDSHLCALATGGVGLCTGDSGGPLVYDGQVYGIASFVIPCGKGVPDVFTRVYFYLNFIKKTMAST